LNFAKGIQKAYSTNWSYINTFGVHFMFGKHQSIQSIWSGIEPRDMNLYIRNINTPQFTNSPIEGYIGDQYKIHNGRNEMYRFTVGFRDFDQLNLYKRFVMNYNYQRTLYFDECKLTVLLSKDADYTNESPSNLVVYENCLIESVSQIQFSNETEAQVVEFDVEFKCTNPIIL